MSFEESSYRGATSVHGEAGESGWKLVAKESGNRKRKVAYRSWKEMERIHQKLEILCRNSYALLINV